MSQETLKSSVREAAKALGATALALIVYLLLAYGAHSLFTSQFPSGNDFYPRWRGTRAFVLEGKDPYSQEVTLEIQRGMYGRPSREGEDQVSFAYPLYVSLLILPFSFFSYSQAQALWMSALVLLTVATVVIVSKTFRWTPSAVGLLALSLWCLFLYPTARSLVLGQFSIVVLALVASALWAMQGDRDCLAGCALAVSTMKPQMVFLVVPFLLLWGLAQRRYRILGGFLGAMGVLLALSSFLLPTWILSFIDGLSRYQAYTSMYREGRSPLGVLVHHLTPSQFSSSATLLVSVALAAYLIYQWVKALRGGGDMYQALFLSVIVTLLIPVQTGTGNQPLLLVPLVYWLTRWDSRQWVMISLSLVLLLGPWALFLSTFGYRNGEHAIMSLALPLVGLVMLSWKRKEADR